MKQLLVIIALLAGSALAAPASAQDSPTAEKTCAVEAAAQTEPGFERTGKQLPDLDFHAAMVACAEAVKESPTSLPDRFRLGRAEIGINNFPQALSDITRAADGGYGPAMEELAWLHQSGQYMPPDYAAALTWAQRGAALDDDASTVMLAVLYQTGEGVARDYDRAIALMQPVAARGNTNAQNDLGLIYECSDNCPQRDYTKAATYFRQAADAGMPNALLSLAALLAWKAGPVYDPVGALAWYKRAASAGEPSALIDLANAYAASDSFVPQNAALAEQIYDQLVDRGYPQGLTGIGYLYFEGAQRPKDMATAAHFFKRAADAGDVNAETNLGNMLINGEGVRADPTRGIAMLEAAGNSGSVDALFWLGQLYSDGGQVPPDLQRGTQYYSRAAALGSTLAMDRLGTIELTGNMRFAADPQMAAQWFEKAAQLGDAEANTKLGVLYREGDGVTKDLQQAMTFLASGAKLGDPDANEQLGEMYETGDGVTADLPKAIGYYKAGSSSPIAQYHLGHLYLEGNAGRENVGLGVPLLESALSAYVRDAAIPLGDAYASGTGVAKDTGMALAAYAKGCDDYAREACIAAAKLQIASGDSQAARNSLTRALGDPATAEEANKLLASLPTPTAANGLPSDNDTALGSKVSVQSKP